jgi:hypothetical protein
MNGNGQEPEVAPASAAYPAPVNELLTAMGQYLHLADAGHVVFALGVAVGSTAKTGEPLWGQIVGPASSGKTEAIRMLDDVADEHPDELTAPSLLSWSKGKNPKPVGILSRIEEQGFLTVGDFSTVLATSDRGGRDQLFALLRRAYDGHVSRDLGNAARPLTWRGRLTLLAACTPAIDAYSTHSDALGPRWLYYRLPAQSAKVKRSTGLKALRAGQLAAHRTDVRALAGKVVNDAADRLHRVVLTESAEGTLIDAAIVACLGRAGVERDGYGRREISGMAMIEEPPRLVSQLALLARSLIAIGLGEGDAVALARRCALDTVPAARLGAMRTLAERKQATASEVARSARCHRHVARFALEELQAIGVTDCFGDEDDRYTPNPWMLNGPEAELVSGVLAADAVARKGGTPHTTHTEEEEEEGLVR